MIKIEKVYDIQEILKCVPIEEEIRKKEGNRYPLKNMLLFIVSQLQNPFFSFWMVYNKEREVIGYMITLMSKVPGMEGIQVIRVWYDHKYPKISKKFWKILKTEAKQNNIKKIMISVERRMKALQKKWKFKLVSVNMERRI